MRNATVFPRRRADIRQQEKESEIPDKEEATHTGRGPSRAAGWREALACSPRIRTKIRMLLARKRRHSVDDVAALRQREIFFGGGGNIVKVFF